MVYTYQYSIHYLYNIIIYMVVQYCIYIIIVYPMYIYIYFILYILFGIDIIGDTLLNKKTRADSNLDSNKFSIGIHFFKVLVQIHYSHPPALFGYHFTPNRYIGRIIWYIHYILYILYPYMLYTLYIYLYTIIQQIPIRKKNKLIYQIKATRRIIVLISSSSSLFQNALAL